MRNVWRAMIGLSLLILGGMVVSRAWADDEPVDLSDKQGVVDPADLKRDDPPEPSLHTEEPPAPEPSSQDNSNSSDQTYGVSPTNGGLPPGAAGAAAVLTRPIPVPER